MISKVLHVIPSVAASEGGPSVMVETMARGLAATGIEIHIATTIENGAEPEIPRGLAMARDGITYWYFERQTQFYKYSRPLSAWLSGHVADYQFVHVHALFSHAPLAAAYRAWRRGVPYAIRPLGTLNRWGMENRRPWLKRLSFELIERRIVDRAAFVHYTSEQEKQEASMLRLCAPSRIIPNPVERPSGKDRRGRFRGRYPELRDREIVLFLSRFDRKKGIDLLLPAFQSVREEFPRAVLALAGSGNAEMAEQIRRQAESLGISHDVFWPGFLQGEDKEAAFADADVFVLPSRSENFGVAAVEAMAAGCPVVVTDQVAIHADISAANAGLVVQCDSSEISEALCRMLKDGAARAAMGTNGKRLARTEYSVEAVTSRLIAAYDSIAGL